MNRIDRLFAILLAIQNSRRIRGQDLAEKFEVSKRTIYRDILALVESGVPIVSLPGEGYELMDGYYLPPINFTETEAIALILGTELLKQQAAGSVTTGATQAIDKITAALPKTIRARVEALTGIIGFLTVKDRFNLDDPRLTALQQAVQGKRVVHIRYHGIERDRQTKRTIEPTRLYYAMGEWYVEAFCRLRGELRTFRLSRIDKLTPGNERFSEQRHVRPERGALIPVRIRFDRKIVRWVRERQHYTFHSERRHPDGPVMHYRVRRFADIMPWTLGWGAGAEVVGPKEFREMVRSEAEKVANMLT